MLVIHDHISHPSDVHWQQKTDLFLTSTYGSNTLHFYSVGILDTTSHLFNFLIGKRQNKLKKRRIKGHQRVILQVYMKGQMSNKKKQKKQKARESASYLPPMPHPHQKI